MFEKILSFYTRYFAIWVIIFGVVAYLVPGPFVAMKGPAQRTEAKRKGRCAHPTPEMLPPKVLQNKVTIYPVLVEE